MRGQLRIPVMVFLLGLLVQFVGDGCGGDDPPTSVSQNNVLSGANFRREKTMEIGDGGCGGGGGVVYIDWLPPYEQLGWRYVQVLSGDPLVSSFYQVNFNDTGWSEGQAAFGRSDVCGSLAGGIHTPWHGLTLLMRHIFTLAAPAPLWLYLAIDDDAKVYVNGTLVGDVVHGGCASLDEFNFSIPSSLVKRGPNVVAVAAVDHGLAAYADIRISKTGPCEVAPTSLDFGRVGMGAYKNMTFDITNTTAWTLEGDVSVPCGDYSIVSGGGPFILGGGASQPVTVRFSPSATGQQTCMVETGAGVCVDVNCVGVGLEPCEVVPGSVDFGTVEVGTFRDKTFTIKNTTTTPLAGDISVACGDYSIVSGGGTFVLDGGANRVVTVRFSPSIPGSQPCTVETGAGVCLDVSCTGTGCQVVASGLGFTVECWVKVRSLPGIDPRIVRCIGPTEGPCGASTTHAWEMWVCKNSCGRGTVGFSIQSAGVCYYVLSSMPVDDGAYHHVAGVYDTGGALRVYVDGVSVGECVTPSVNACVDGGTLVVGNATAPPPSDNPFDGEIDELRVWNVARSSSEIVQGMAGEISPTGSLIGYWRFNGDGSDLASPSNPLVVLGNVTFVTGRPGFGQAVDVHNPPYSRLAATAVAEYNIGSCSP